MNKIFSLSMNKIFSLSIAFLACAGCAAGAGEESERAPSVEVKSVGAEPKLGGYCSSADSDDIMYPDGVACPGGGRHRMTSDLGNPSTGD